MAQKNEPNKNCPQCSGRLVRAGNIIQRTGHYQRMQCISCGRYFKGEKI